jgi:hypothetical protein
MFTQDEQRQLVADRADALKWAGRRSRTVRRWSLIGLIARH